MLQCSQSKPLCVLLTVLMAVVPFLGGCSSDQTAAGPDPTGITEIDPGSTDTSTISASVTIDSAGVMERVIAMMDPYVTTDSTGAYELAYETFLEREGASLTTEERRIADELEQGVPTANQALADMRRNPQSMALGSSYSVNWWGVTCCYTGTTAQQIANVLAAGGVVSLWIPYLGAALSFSGAWLQIYITAWGGFCLHVPWTFVITHTGAYMSRP